MPRDRSTPRMSATGYVAFLSYSHTDEKIADWLHRRLESYAIPSSFAGREGPNGVIGRRLGRIFRDRSELSAAPDLSAEIKKALQKSSALILLCSPGSAKSPYVNEEIRIFKQSGGSSRIYAAIVSGEPHASTRSELDPGLECFPKALLYQIDSDGLISNTLEPIEPLAADLREDKDGREGGALKLIAGLLDVGLDELVQRERQAERRRRRRANTLAAAMSLLAIAALIAGGLAIWQSKKARRNAVEAAQEAIKAQRNEQTARDNATKEVIARHDADTQRDRAKEEQQLAVGRSLAATAEAITNGADVNAKNPTRTREILPSLAIESMRRLPTGEANELAAKMTMFLGDLPLKKEGGGSMDEIMFLPGKTEFAILSSGLRFFDIAKNREEDRSIKREELGSGPHGSPSLRFGPPSPDGRYIAISASNNTDFIVDTSSHLLRAVPVPSDDLDSVVFSRNSKYLASINREKSDGPVLNLFSLPAFSNKPVPLGKQDYMVHLGAFDSDVAIVLEENSVVTSGFPPSFIFTEYSFSDLHPTTAVSDGRHLFIGLEGSRSSPAPATVFDGTEGRYVPVPEIRSSRPKKLTLPQGSAPGLYKINILTGQAIKTASLAPLKILLSQDKKQLFLHLQNQVCVLEISTGQTSQCANFGDENAVTSTGRSGSSILVSNGPWLVAAQKSGWLFKNLNNKREGTIPQSEPEKMLIARDSSIAVGIGGRDVVLVDPDTMHLLARLNGMVDVEKLSLDDSGRFLVVISPDGPYIARLKPSDLVGHLCSKPGTNLTPEEWKKYLGNLPWQPTCPSWK